MPVRLLLLMVLVAALYWLLRRLPRRRDRRPDAARTVESRMLRCAHCHLYIPEQEAVRDRDGRSFCSPDHRQRFRET